MNIILFLSKTKKNAFLTGLYNWRSLCETNTWFWES